MWSLALFMSSKVQCNPSEVMNKLSMSESEGAFGVKFTEIGAGRAASCKGGPMATLSKATSVSRDSE